MAPKLKSKLPRERISATLDVELLTVLRVLKENSGMSFSMVIETLLLAGLRCKMQGQKLEFDVAIKNKEGEELKTCQ